ncbi:MAG: hypothetical protein WAV76_08390 [Bacteroidota bacterium]
MFSLCITGCNKLAPTEPNPQSGSLSQIDKQTLDNIISQDALFTSDAATLDDGSATRSLLISNSINGLLPNSASDDTVFTPLAWGRTFSGWTSNKAYDQVNDSIVIATITNTLTGKLWIYSTIGIKQKPITMITIRNVKFFKEPFKDSTRWVEKFVSVMQGNTTSGIDTIAITDLTFFAGNEMIDVTSPPDEYYLQTGIPRRHGLPDMVRDASRKFTIQATVLSSTPDSDVVVLYHPNNAVVRIRERMAHVSVTSNGNETYTHVYKRSWLGDIQGRHTITVSALSKRSLYDTTAAVTSQEWGIPYIVQ